ncbi:hypothetical protein GGX14DRAFT_626393 [Mycena pura]|uniref:F-box domain-containing protein n=1 Tax=Mycena pura TaxID=153505 RepID=A0AAD6VDZ8_9AGAR|nr:hypothetical protein GGX14DRAFT_626393 [Mycena pura]
MTGAGPYHPTCAVTAPRFSDELFIEIFEHLTDADLLSLATISKHIHDLALLSHLERHGITVADIESHSVPLMSTDGAFHALRIARFVTAIEALRLRFDPSPKLHRDVSALEKFAQRLPPIKIIDLEFPPKPGRVQILRSIQRSDMVGLLLTLTSAYHTRPAMVISPLNLSIVRPRKPSFYAIRRLYSAVRAIGSRKHARAPPSIKEQEFRAGLFVLPLLRRVGIIPDVSIRVFDPPEALGSLIVLRATVISSLRLPSLRTEETSAVFAHLTLPHLRIVEGSFTHIEPTALYTFLTRHPSLQTLALRGPPPDAASDKSVFKHRNEAHFDIAPLAPLPADALPQLQHLRGSSRLAAWVLASPHSFHGLTAATFELHPGPTAQRDYAAALRGAARRPALTTLALHLHGWAPWNARRPEGEETPESCAEHVADLRLTFKMPATHPRGAALMRWTGWFRLWAGLREVSLFDSLQLENLCVVLKAELPHIRFSTYELARTD